MRTFQGGLASGYSGIPHAGEPGAGLLRLLHELAVIPVSEWIVALVCAVIAAIIYEWTVKAAKGANRVARMLPSLLLRLTRLTTSREKYLLLYERQWYPDLHDLLTDTSHKSFVSEGPAVLACPGVRRSDPRGPADAGPGAAGTADAPRVQARSADADGHQRRLLHRRGGHADEVDCRRPLPPRVGSRHRGLRLHARCHGGALAAPPSSVAGTSAQP